MDDNMQSPSPGDADSQSSQEASYAGVSNSPAVYSIKRNSGDIGWEWGECRDPSNLDRVWCKLCGKMVSGGIHRLKLHLVHQKGNVSGCPNVSIEVQRKVNKSLVEVRKKRAHKARINSILEKHNTFSGRDDKVDVEEEKEIVSIGGSWNQSQDNKMQPPNDILPGNFGVNRKRKDVSNVIGPLDTFFKKQTSIDKDSPYEEKSEKDVWKKIFDWVIECNIPLSAVLSPSFEDMINAFAEYGRAGFTWTDEDIAYMHPTKQYERAKEFFNSFRKHWETYGCSLMVDVWTDENGNTLINFLVNCLEGTVFYKSINASKHVNDAKSIRQIVSKVIWDLGEENIIQVITNNDSNFKAAGSILQEKHPQIFWTPCATHSLNLMLQDIGHMVPHVKHVLAEARAIVIYIYNIEEVLDMLLKLTNGLDLHKSSAVKYATSYYTLKSILENKKHLQALFTSEQWMKSKTSKSPSGENVAKIVAKKGFWDDVELACLVLGPLVDVLRLVNTEEKPSMGFIYEAIDDAKEQIEKNLGSRMRVCTMVWNIIDNRWTDQLSHPLYAAGFYLNPAIYHKNSTEIEKNVKIKSGLYKAIDRLVFDDEEHNEIRLELIKYRNAEDLFEYGTDISLRERMTPRQWWSMYGGSTPKLQKFAMRVLIQTCSASPAVRRRRVFEILHSKRRHLERQLELRKHAYIQYNTVFQIHYNERKNGNGQANKERKVNDPIVSRHIDEDDEWIIPTDEELQGLHVTEEEENKPRV